MLEDPKFLKKYFGMMENVKQGFLPTYDDIQTYLLPNHPPMYNRDMPGTRRSGTKVFDDSPTNMIYRLSASLNNIITNPSSKWFHLETDDDEVNDAISAREWFDKTAGVIYKTLENSNFYQEMYKVYVSLVTYGTGVLFIEPSTTFDKELNFSARNIKEVFFSENFEGEVDTIFRLCEFTARQLVEEFGKRMVSDGVKKAFDDNPEEYFQVIHAVFPRNKRDNQKRNPENMRYASVWFENESLKKLRVSGYNSFPYVTPRWYVAPGEMYGRGPGEQIIANVKTLNKGMKALLNASQKIAEPMIQIPDENFSDVKTMKPNMVLHYDATNPNAIARPIEIGGNIPITIDILQTIRDNIANALYVNQLYMVDHKQMTAEEVRARQAENARVLGPTFGMFQHDLLSPLIDRVIDILSRSSDFDGNPILPQPPEELVGKNLRLKFSSPLSKSAKYYETESIQYTVNTALAWSEANPTVLDNLDMDEAIRIIADADGTPPSVVRELKQVAGIRQARQQQQEQARQQQQMVEGAEALKKGAEGAKKLGEVAKIDQEVRANE